MKLVFNTAVLLFSINLAFAGDITIPENPNYPVLFVYQNDGGYYSGCGPVQCLLTAYETKDAAIDKMTHDWHLPLDFEFNHGRCEFYSGTVDSLSPSDATPGWIVGRHNKYC